MSSLKGARREEELRRWEEERLQRVEEGKRRWESDRELREEETCRRDVEAEKARERIEGPVRSDFQTRGSTDLAATNRAAAESEEKWRN